MSQVLSVFGIDWRLLLINAVNFGLVLLALWYFLYAPVLKMLEERRKKVSDGVRDAESAKRELVQKGEATAATLMRDASAQAAELQRRSIEESKQEVAKLIVLGMEKAFKTKS